MQYLLDPILHKLEYGTLEVTTPRGRQLVYKGKIEQQPVLQMHIHDWKAIRQIISRGDVGMGESYIEGLWDTDDLLGLLDLLLKNKTAFGQGLFKGNMLQIFFMRIVNFFRRNNLRTAKKNIKAHYDVGNDFYRLWLDESMTYSSALFHSKEESLYEAQQRKYGRILEHISDAESVLEIGCGWGGFAENAAKQGKQLKGLTLSPSQLAYAEERISMHDNAVLALQDYRHEDRVYESIVSIEMFEAVGKEYWDSYFAKIKACLHRSGSAVIQTITIDNPLFEGYAKSSDFIRRYTFPGGLLPSPDMFVAYANKAGLAVHDAFNFGKDYAETLKRWLHNLDAATQQIMSLGYDETFLKSWRYYLAYCHAGFNNGTTDVYQYALVHDR